MTKYNELQKDVQNLTWWHNFWMMTFWVSVGTTLVFLSLFLYEVTSISQSREKVYVPSQLQSCATEAPAATKPTKITSWVAVSSGTCSAITRGYEGNAQEYVGGLRFSYTPDITTAFEEAPGVASKVFQSQTAQAVELGSGVWHGKNIALSFQSKFIVFQNSYSKSVDNASVKFEGAILSDDTNDCNVSWTPSAHVMEALCSNLSFVSDCAYARRRYQYRQCQFVIFTPCQLFIDAATKLYSRAAHSPTISGCSYDQVFCNTSMLYCNSKDTCNDQCHGTWKTNSCIEVPPIGEQSVAGMGCCSFTGGASCSSSEYCDQNQGHCTMCGVITNAPVKYCPRGVHECVKPTECIGACNRYPKQTGIKYTKDNLLRDAKIDVHYGQYSLSDTHALTLGNYPEGARVGIVQELGYANGVHLSKPNQIVTFEFHNIDVSTIPKGVVGTMYTSALPSEDATGVMPGGYSWLNASVGEYTEKAGHMRAYCDAQGCANWLSDYWGSCTDNGQDSNYEAVKHRPACAEFDMFEANRWGFSVTSHYCDFSTPDYTVTEYSCDRNGHALTVKSPRKTPTYQFDYKQTDKCSKLLPGVFYGPDESCAINTLKPFDLKLEFDGANTTATLSQTKKDDKLTSIVGKMVNTIPTEDIARHMPMTLMAAMWGRYNENTTHTEWLDNCQENECISTLNLEENDINWSVETISYYVT